MTTPIEYNNKDVEKVAEVGDTNFKGWGQAFGEVTKPYAQKKFSDWFDTLSDGKKNAVVGAQNFFANPATKYVGGLADDVLRPMAVEELRNSTRGLFARKRPMSMTTKGLIAAGTAAALGIGGAAAYKIHQQNKLNDNYDKMNGYGEYYGR